MDDRRQNNQQLQLAFTVGSRGEAPRAAEGGTEPSVAKHASDSLVSTHHLMEEVCEAENLSRALKRVRTNKGSPGVDGMTVEKLPGHLKEHWPTIKQQLLAGTYKPQPVKRVEIAKPGGGTRQLGVPTVLNRFIQQAVLQVLEGVFEPTFSEHSYGFRPGRSAHQAVSKAQGYIAEGHGWVVDLDLEKFFDRVNHDMLMARVARKVADKRVLRLIRGFLNSGVMDGGPLSPARQGTPQGGPLSPLLSNIVLDELDRELEQRGHRFVRYADDCNIYVRTPRAGQRVMEGIKAFIEKRLKLKVNEKKSAVGRPRERKFLGFSFMGNREAKRRIAPEAIERFKKRVRELTRRTRGMSLRQMIEGLTPYVRGWGNFFSYCQTPSVMEDLNAWLRRRLRSVSWKQWRRGRRRYAQLRRRGVPEHRAATAAGRQDGPWRMSNSIALRQGLSDSYLRSLGLPTLVTR